MSIESKLNYCQKDEVVKIHENLSFVNQQNKYTPFFPSIKPVFTVISSYLTRCVIDCLKVKMFYAERINYVDRLNILNASIYVLANNNRIFGSLWLIFSSKQVDKTDVVMTIHNRC